MTTWKDVGTAATINLVAAFVFLFVFSVWRLQPQNGRVYFPKWYINGVRKASVVDPLARKISIAKFVNLDYKAYAKLFTWMPAAMKMTEQQLIDHAGLDSAVFLRIFMLGLKIFIPIMIVAFAVIVPINMTGDNLNHFSGLANSDMSVISITNVKDKSNRLWAHLAMSYIFTIWTCVMLYLEFRAIADLRVRHLLERKRAPDQFTVLVRQVKPAPGKSIHETVEDFFSLNHPEYLQTEIVYNANKLAEILKKIEVQENWLQFSEIKYDKNPDRIPTKKLGFCGVVGKQVDSIDYYTKEIDRLKEQAKEEYDNVVGNSKLIMPAAFVSFKSRWAAAVCAQTQQTRNTTKWLTEWAPEPRDVYWRNLAIPYFSRTMRNALMAASLILLIIFYAPPILFVQSLANIYILGADIGILRPITRHNNIQGLIEGFVPGLGLKLFTLVVPSILMVITKFEGHLSRSTLDRVAAAKFYYFLVISVGLLNVISGGVLSQLQEILNGSPLSQVLKTFGQEIPAKANFFVTYIMVDMWAGGSWEALRLIPLIVYHIKNTILVRTPKDRDRAMAPGNLCFNVNIPRMELYFLVGVVFSVMSPIILPFIIVAFAYNYVIYRNQVINVYEADYDSAASFWPHIHSRIVAAMIIEHLILIGVFTLKGPIGFVKKDKLSGPTHQALTYMRQILSSTIFMVLLPLCTMVFHVYCRRRFTPVFENYPLEDANAKDRKEKEGSPDLDLKAYLNRAYENPALKAEEANIRKERFIIRPRKPDVRKGTTDAPPQDKEEVDEGGTSSPEAVITVHSPDQDIESRGPGEMLQGAGERAPRGRRREAVFRVPSPRQDIEDGAPSEQVIEKEERPTRGRREANFRVPSPRQDIESGAPSEQLIHEEERPSRGGRREGIFRVPSPRQDIEGGAPRDEELREELDEGKDKQRGENSKDPTEEYIDALTRQSSLQSEGSPNTFYDAPSSPES